jgi:LysM repeat protein
MLSINAIVTKNNTTTKFDHRLSPVILAALLSAGLSLGCSDEVDLEAAAEWYQPFFADPEQALLEPAEGAFEPLADEPLAAALVEPGPYDDEAAVAAEPNEAAMGEARLVVIKVQRGETVPLFSKWAGIPTEELRALNQMGKRRNLRIGAAFNLMLDPAAYRRFSESRTNHFTQLEKEFFAKFEVVRLERYEITRGDNIWKISKLHESVPVWVLEKFNSNVDLSKLKVGDELLVPVLNEVVAATDLFGPEAEEGAKGAIAGKPAAKKAKPEVREDEGGIQVTVGRNETVGHYAKWCGCSVKKIKAVNPDLNPDRIRMGQQVLIPLKDSRLAHFWTKRRRFNGTKAPAEIAPVRKPRAAAAAKAPKKPARPAAAKKPVKPGKASKAAVAATVKPAAKPSKAVRSIKSATPAKLAKPEGQAVAAGEKSGAGADSKKPAAPKQAQVAKAPAKLAPAKPSFVRHTVADGETAWKIAVRRYKISLQALRRANPGKDLDRLSVGQVLTIPVKLRQPGGGSVHRTP